MAKQISRPLSPRRRYFERLESRIVLAVSLTRNNQLVEMDMGDFLVKFDTQFGGAPLTWINQKSGTDVVITNPFPGAGAQVVWNEGSSPTQASASGPTANPIAFLGDTTSPQSFYGRETAFQVRAQEVTYEVSGFAPIFWWQALSVNDLPAVDAVPPDVAHEWLTKYSPGSIGNNDPFWTGCTSNPRGCVPVVFEGTSQESVFMLGSEAAAYAGIPLWNHRLQSISDGRVAMRARISLAETSDPQAIGSLMFQRRIPQSAGVTAKMAAASPGYFLTINKFGEIVLGRISDSNGNQEMKWSVSPNAARANSVNSTTGILLEVRTIRSGTSDTFEIWVDENKVGSWTDPRPIRGPHVGLFARASTGRVKFTDREVFDLNVEYVARYTGFADGHLQSDLRIRNVSGAAASTNMTFSNLPIVFLGPAINPANTLGVVYNVFGDEICYAERDSQPCLVPLGVAEDRGFAMWLGEPGGSNGVFTVPRIAEVNGAPAVAANTQVVNGNPVIGNDIRVVQLNPFFSFPGPSVPISSARVVADCWPRIVPLPPPPTAKVSISDATLRAENNGALSFQITLDHVSTVPVTVNFETRDDSAIAGMDYDFSRGRIVFSPGETVHEILVQAKEDEFIENSETFEVILTSVVNATIADGKGVGTIRDDEEPKLTFSPSRTFAEGNQTSTHVAVPVTLSDIPTTAPIKFAYSMADSTARAGQDFVGVAGEITFDVVAEVAGTKRPTIEVRLELIGNCRPQSDRTFTIRFEALTDGVKVEGGPIEVTIADDDLDGDLNCDQKLDHADIDRLADAIRAHDLSFDQDGNGRMDTQDIVTFVDRYFQTVLGDTNLDRRFDSTDLVAVFTAGKYENEAKLDSGWLDGDWNGDGDFDTSDLVAAFRAGGYRAE